MAFQINKVDTDGYWMVGSTHIYIPSVETKVEHSNVTGSSTGRSEDGVMRIDWIRRDVRKVYLKYKYMTAVFHVHDEVICEVDHKDDLNRILDIMAEPLDWAPGLPLKGAGFCAEYYQKD